MKWRRNLATRHLLKAALSWGAFRDPVHQTGMDDHLKQLQRHRLTRLVWIALALGISPAAAQGGAAIATNGTAAGAPACASCHGAHGEGNAENGYPRLAGLNAAYLVHQLASFVDGTRKSDIMPDIAKALTPAERQAVTAFYAGQQVLDSGQPTASDAKLAARGVELAVNGDWQHGIPGCGQCHGPAGQGVGVSFPRLAGQSATYIENQIAAWKDGKRSNDPLHLMSGLARKLSNDDVKAIAAYYAGLDGSKDSGHE